MSSTHSRLIVLLTTILLAVGSMHAVYGLLGLKHDIPPIHHAIADPKVALDALKTLMG